MKVLQFVPKRFGVLYFRFSFLFSKKIGVCQANFVNFRKCQISIFDPPFSQNIGWKSKIRKTSSLRNGLKYLHTKFEGSIIYILTYILSSPKIDILRKTHFFAVDCMILDTKFNYQNAITLVLVGIFSFSKN